MAKVYYTMMVSLDGYVEDPEGGIGFSDPADDVHAAANGQAREATMLLFGRRMYEAMEQPWRSIAARPDAPPLEAEFAQLYLATPRVVFSDTLDQVPGGVRLVRSPDAAAEVARLKDETEGHLDLGGATLAASLLDLVDEIRLYVLPVVLGGGKPVLPSGRRRCLRLTEHREFASGTVYLAYRNP